MSEQSAQYPKLGPRDLDDPSLHRLNGVFNTAFDLITDLQNKVASASSSTIITKSLTPTSGGATLPPGPTINPAGFTTTAINAAIAALPSTGGIVQLLDGSYAYDGLITSSKSNIAVVGNGTSSVIQGNATVTTGNGIFNLSGTDVILYNFLIDGGVTTATKLLYSAFSSDPMDSQLTDNTSIWIKPGAKRVTIDGVWITHTGGYGILLDADTADISDVTIVNCNFYNNRPHLFGVVSGDISGSNGYGSWTGGIFYRGDCRNSTGKPYAVRGLTVQNCRWRRVTGNCLWGHSKGFDTQHTSINALNNDIEDAGLDGIEYGNVYGGTAKGNVFHRVGYITQTDSDAPDPRYLTLKWAVCLDTSGFVRGVTYDGNSGTSMNGEFIDLDGFRDGVVSNNVGIIPYSTDPQYTEDSVASYQNNGAGGNTTIGIQTGNTSQNGGATNVKIIGNTLINFGVSAITLAFAKNCTATNNTIQHPTNAISVPIQLYSASGASPADEWHCHDNVVESNAITYTGSNFTIAETGTDWAGTDVNKVFLNRVFGANYGEFSRASASASTVGFSIGTNSPTEGAATTRKATLIHREGSDSSAALKIYVHNVDADTRTQLAQFADDNFSLNISNNGTAKTGAIATGNRTTFAFPDVMAAGKLLADSCLILTDTTMTYPNDSDLDILTNAYGLIRYNSTSHAFEASSTVSGGHRVWVSFGGASSSVGGSDKMVQYNKTGSFFGDVNFQWDYTNKALTVAGTAAQVAIFASSGYIQSSGGFVSTADSWQAVQGQASGGGALFAAYALAQSGAASKGGYIDMAPLTYANFPTPLTGLGSFGATDVLIWASGVNSTGSPNTTVGLNTNSFVNAASGFVTTSAAANAIQAPSGGMLANWLTASQFLQVAQLGGPPSAPSSGFLRMYADSSNVLKYWDYSSSTWKPLVSGSSQWTTSGSDIYYTTGRVSIGTATPSAFGLTIKGSPGAIALQGGVQTGIIFQTASGGNGISIGRSAGSTDDNTFYIFDQVAAQFRMTISSAGLIQVQGQGSGLAGLSVSAGYIQSAEGYLSNSTGTLAVNIPSGGGLFKYLAVTGNNNYNDFQVTGGGIYTSQNVTIDRALVVKSLGSAPTAPGSGYSALSHVSGAVWRYYNTSSSSWATIDFSAAGGAVPGSNTWVIYNNSGSLGASSSFTWNNGTGVLSITGGMNASGAIQSNASGASICFQANGGVWAVDGTGNCSGGGEANFNGGYKVGGVQVITPGGGADFHMQGVAARGFNPRDASAIQWFGQDVTIRFNSSTQKLTWNGVDVNGIKFVGGSLVTTA
jgi:hypothetical protein